LSHFSLDALLFQVEVFYSVCLYLSFPPVFHLFKLLNTSSLMGSPPLGEYASKSVTAFLLIPFLFSANSFSPPSSVHCGSRANRNNNLKLSTLKKQLLHTHPFNHSPTPPFPVKEREREKYAEFAAKVIN
jgi:hypothetical protein